MADLLTAGQASVWLQRHGPNTKPEYLGCHEVGDVDEPLGDVTTFYCPDPARTGKWKVAGSVQGEPGAPTTTITTDVAKVADLLERLECPGTLFVHKVACGRRDIFTNYDRSFVFANTRPTSRGLSNLAARDPGAEDRTTQNFDLSAEALLRILTLNGVRQTLSATEDVLAIAFCADAKCADDCGPAADACQYGVLVTKSSLVSAGMPEVYYTINGGVTWVQTVADPFAVGEDISAVVCFPISRTVTRIIVARGTTDAMNPAEIAYSDDNGANWTSVTLTGTPVGDFIVESEGLFALDYAHIWVVTESGYILFSGDAGITWTIQDAGILTVNPLNCVEFIDPNVGYVAGDLNEMDFSDDGGDSWTAITLPAAEAAAMVDALEVIDQEHLWVGYSNGHLYFSLDGGASWTLRTLPVALTSITEIEFTNELVGFLVGNGAGPLGHSLRTIDGGYTWEALTIPSNAGLNDLWVCGINEAFFVGDASGGTGFVGKAFAA